MRVDVRADGDTTLPDFLRRFRGRRTFHERQYGVWEAL
jgi:hypothetical protein